MKLLTAPRDISGMENILEAMLASVRAGDIVGFAMLVDGGSGATWFRGGYQNLPAQLFAFEMWKHEVMALCVADNEDGVTS